MGRRCGLPLLQLLLQQQFHLVEGHQPRPLIQPLPVGLQLLFHHRQVAHHVV